MEPMKVGDTVDTCPYFGWYFPCMQKIMKKWQDEGDEESLFWKFVAALIPQIDPREKDELVYMWAWRGRTDECAAVCHMVRLGQKTTFDGKHRGEARALQMRCTYCGVRNKRAKTPALSPPTAWGCSVHSKIYACKNKNCWEDHLTEVHRSRDTEFVIWVSVRKICLCLHCIASIFLP